MVTDATIIIETKMNSTSMISTECCFLSSCIDLDDSDLRSSLLHFVGMNSNYESNNQDTKYDTLIVDDDDKVKDRCQRYNSYPNSIAAERGNTKNMSIPSLSLSYSGNTTKRGNYHHTLSKSRKNKSHHHNTPPPIIALSRSSFSNSSESSASSSLASPDFEDQLMESNLSFSTTHNVRLDINGRMVEDDDDNDEHNDDECIDTIRTYEARHELLINSLFEDARRRHEMSSSTATTQENIHQLRNSSISTSDNKSVVSKGSKGSKYSSRTSSSSRSNESELLTPSLHRFQKTLRSRGTFGIHLPLPGRLLKQKNFLKKVKMIGNKKRRSSISYGSIKSQHTHHHRLHVHQSDCTACGGSMTASSPSTNAASLLTITPPDAVYFLHENVELQKDSGKGLDIGKSISASGRDDTLKKLNDKMDILAEMERDDNWSNATVTRIPAKNITLEKCKSRGGMNVEQYYKRQGYIETRSMLAVKLGYISLKYGILVHWNTHSDLADLILLRKNCPESFMKCDPSNGSVNKKKGKTWMKRKSNR